MQTKCTGLLPARGLFETEIPSQAGSEDDHTRHAGADCQPPLGYNASDCFISGWRTFFLAFISCSRSTALSLFPAIVPALSFSYPIHSTPSICLSFLEYPRSRREKRRRCVSSTVHVGSSVAYLYSGARQQLPVYYCTRASRVPAAYEFLPFAKREETRCYTHPHTTCGRAAPDAEGHTSCIWYCDTP